MTRTYARRELTKTRREITIALKGFSPNNPERVKELALLRMREEMLVSFLAN